MTKTETCNPKSTPRTRSSKRVDAPSEAASLVDAVRGVVRLLVLQGTSEAIENALSLVETSYARVAEACPVTEDLRPWQLLASDLAAALSPIDPARAETAATLADGIRTAVVMIARNPASELVLRPASRRVLAALHALGGQANLVMLRERSSHSATHLSNILRPLGAHGLIEVVPAQGDRRHKEAVLTREGWKAAAELATTTHSAHVGYQGYLKRTEAEAPEQVYPAAAMRPIELSH